MDGTTGDFVEIRDTLREIMELQPVVPRLHRLAGLLREQEWDEGREEDGGGEDEGEDNGGSIAEVAPFSCYS